MFLVWMIQYCKYIVNIVNISISPEQIYKFNVIIAVKFDFLMYLDSKVDPEDKFHKKS